MVLHDKDSLPEGMRVEVNVKQELAPSDQPAKQERKAASPLGEGLMKLAGTAVGLPQDMASQHDHYLHGTPKR